ncbi:MAG TPA: peptide chain release factor 1 [Actinomycetota bacterium]|nr:peptide chain release factor 1 [Actinomycetota bacterium]
MRDRLEEIEAAYEELNQELSSPEVASDPTKLRDLGKRHRELGEIVAASRAWRKATADAEEARALAADESDPESRAFYEQEADRAAAQAEELRAQIEVLLLPRDPNDEKNVVVEIRAGEGGEEAALWAGDLLEMYLKYAERRRWKTDVLASSPSSLGGYDKVILEIRGDGAYSRLKHESGVHRVQRVPQTESQGRIHTSAASVAVLPEAEEVDVEIRPEDIEVDVFRSSGPGGQSVNTTDSAVRLTHKPTGIVVSVQEERSQLQNRDKAMRYLRARLLQMEQERQQQEQAEARRAQVGGGGRAEKIRTYNFPESRVTDHRINLKVHRLEQVLQGELDEFIDALLAEERAKQLRAGG